MTSAARIQFARYPGDAPPLDFLRDYFALQSSQIQNLLDLGAVYLNQRRWNQEPVREGDIFRVHLKPRRYPIGLWTPEAVLETHADWIAVWKPSGLPSHETLDNVQENAKAACERCLGEKLWSLSRLDVGTRGLLLFARNKSSARELHEQSGGGGIQKFYETFGPRPRAGCGRWVDFMRKSDRAPRELASEPSPDFSLRCELELVDWHEVRDGAGRGRVQLVTGRTHQIRAQFATREAPLWGDALYGSNVAGPADRESFALSCEELRFQWKNQNFELKRPSAILALDEEWTT